MGLWEDWRNKKLQEALDAGINPFIELDLDNLPAEGADASVYFPGRKVYGNIVDGITTVGAKVDSGGLIHYEEDNLHGTNTLDTIYSLQLTNGNWNKWNWLSTSIPAHAPFAAKYNTPSATPTSLTDFDVHRAESALVGGTGGHACYAPGAGKKFVAYWAFVGSSNVVNPQTTYYDIIFSEETSGTVINHVHILGSEMGLTKIPLYFDSGTADKDLECTVDNGVGGETFYTAVVAGRHS